MIAFSRIISSSNRLLSFGIELSILFTFPTSFPHFYPAYFINHLHHHSSGNNWFCELNCDQFLTLPSYHCIISQPPELHSHRFELLRLHPVFNRTPLSLHRYSRPLSSPSTPHRRDGLVLAILGILKWGVKGIDLKAPDLYDPSLLSSLGLGQRLSVADNGWWICLYGIKVSLHSGLRVFWPVFFCSLFLIPLCTGPSTSSGRRIIKAYYLPTYHWYLGDLKMA